MDIGSKPGEARTEPLETFLATGWSSVTSPSIVRDCGNVIADIYYLARRLDLVPANRDRDELVKHGREVLAGLEADQATLHELSSLVAQSLFEQARAERSYVSTVYDMIKHLQSFHTLLSNIDIQTHARHLLQAHTVFVHKDSVGIRIDLPSEEANLTNLHQEFHSFPFGTNGLVLWIPLTRIDLKHGTLGYYPRPHNTPPIPYSGNAADQQRLLAEGRLQEAQKVGGLQVTAAELGPRHHLEVEPGHCYIFSAVLPHESVPAQPDSTAARITCQARLFDIDDNFFRWKLMNGRFWDGLKQPTVGWDLWKEYVK